MEEHEKALEKNKLAQKVLKDCGCRSELIRSVVDAANVYIGLGRYEAAMETLKEHEKGENPLILMTVGKVFIHQQNVAVAKECLEFACRVLNKMEKSKPLEVADAYIMIADQYETMNDVETAIFLLLRALALLEKLFEEKHLKEGVLTRIGCLLLLTDKLTRAMTIPCLERPAEVKKIYGSKHFGVGYIYNKLGRAYLELERPELAAEMFVVAKDILGFYLGPHYNESIHTCQNLLTAYAAMSRWSKCRDTTDIVKRFKSAIISESYLILPTLASLAYSRPIYHIDSNFVDSSIDHTFQIGIVARSQEGYVLWAMIVVVDMRLLMPYSLAMGNIDINMAEIAGFGYITIHARELGISDFLVFTDSKLSRDYLGSTKNKISNKSHRFLVVLGKQLWFYSNMTGKRVIWVNKEKNEVANALSRTRSDYDEWMQRFYQGVQVELPNFIERIEIQKKKGGTEVEKGDDFEEILQETMRKFDD